MPLKNDPNPPAYTWSYTTKAGAQGHGTASDEQDLLDSLKIILAFGFVHLEVKKVIASYVEVKK